MAFDDRGGSGPPSGARPPSDPTEPVVFGGRPANWRSALLALGALVLGRGLSTHLRDGVALATALLVFFGVVGIPVAWGWSLKVVVTRETVGTRSLLGTRAVPRSQAVGVVVDRRNRSYLVDRLPTDISRNEIRRVTRRAPRVRVPDADVLAGACGVPVVRAERPRFGCFGLTAGFFVVVLVALLVGIAVTEIW